MGKLVLREAGPADLALVQALGRESYTEHFSYLWRPAGLQINLYRHFADEVVAPVLADTGGHTWLLAEETGIAVGYARGNWAVADPVSGRIGAERQKIYLPR